MAENCPVCNTELRTAPLTQASEVREYSCGRCGHFLLTDELLQELPTWLDGFKERRPKISHALRRAQDAKTTPLLSLSTFKKMLEVPFPSPPEQVDLFIRWIAKTSDCPGEVVPFSKLEAESVVGARSKEGLDFILQYIGDEKLAEMQNISGLATRLHDKSAKITFKGWEHYEQIRKGSTVYRKAFMAMQYGKPELENAYTSAFKPSVSQAGFELIRQDQRYRAGLIDNLMRVEIQGADFLIADLTHRNPGAYWEAGFAEGLGKPVIYTCEESVFKRKKTHFDTNHHYTILWNRSNQIQAGEELKATIRASLPHLAKMSD